MSDDNQANAASLMAASIHDMKNSLGVILNSVDDLCNDNGDNERQQRQLNLLRLEGRRLNNYFIQLLALYRIENGQYFAALDEHNLYDCLEEVLLENEAILAHKNIEAEIRCDDALEWVFDRNLVQGVLNTILNNACRHAGSRITLAARPQGDQLEISILDDGEGYPAAMLDRNRTSQNDVDFFKGGTGLGLHFSEVVAAMHHRGEVKGHIEINNNGIDGGAGFFLYLP